MAVIWFVAQVVYALLAAFGLLVLAAFGWFEGVPRFRLWSADVQEGYARYRAVRDERRVTEQAIGAVVQSHQVVELAKQRMAAAARGRSPQP